MTTLTLSHLGPRISTVILVAALVSSCSGQAGEPTPGAVSGEEAATTAAAADDDGSRGRGSWLANPETIAALGLSDEQLARLRANEQESNAKLAAARRAEWELTRKIIRTLEMPEVNQEVLARNQAALVDAVQTRYGLFVGRVATMRTILTLQQWRQLRQIDASAFRIGPFMPPPLAVMKIGEGEPVDGDSGSGSDE